MNQLSKFTNEQLLEEIHRRMKANINESVNVRNLSVDKHTSMILDVVSSKNNSQYKGNNQDGDIMKHCMNILR